jgi:hypothetical protein
MRFLFILIGCFIVSFDSGSQTIYSIQGALASARTNNPFLKTEGFNINIA